MANDLDSELQLLACQLADITDLSVAQAILAALQEGLEEQRKHRFEKLEEISRHCAALPVKDERSPDAIIGYDEYGLPT